MDHILQIYEVGITGPAWSLIITYANFRPYGEVLIGPGPYEKSLWKEKYPGPDVRDKCPGRPN